MCIGIGALGNTKIHHAKCAIRRPLPAGDVGQLANDAAVFGRAFDFRPFEGPMLVSTAMFHGGSHIYYMGGLNVGHSLVIMGRFDPEAIGPGEGTRAQAARIGEFGVRRIAEYTGPFIAPEAFVPGSDRGVPRAARAARRGVCRARHAAIPKAFPLPRAGRIVRRAASCRHGFELRGAV